MQERACRRESPHWPARRLCFTPRDEMTAARLLIVSLIVVCCSWAQTEDHDGATSERDDKVMKIVTRPYPQQGPPQYNKQQQQQGPQGSRGEVSETDVFLLGAIEKLAYRLDLMEKRLRRTEDLLFHVMAGQNSHKQPGDKVDPCPANFTRAAGGCYLFSSEEGTQPADWQVASLRCKEAGGTLAELATVEETQDLVTHVKTNPRLRDKSYWTGGLNPGLLWIWADSGRPVSASGGHKKPGKLEIRGSGRCLLLAYDAGVRSYGLAGADCAMRQHYICEVEDNSTGRALERIQRNLRLGRPANSTQDD